MNSSALWPIIHTCLPAATAPHSWHTALEAGSASTMALGRRVLLLCTHALLLSFFYKDKITRTLIHIFLTAFVPPNNFIIPGVNGFVMLCHALSLSWGWSFLALHSHSRLCFLWPNLLTSSLHSTDIDGYCNSIYFDAISRIRSLSQSQSLGLLWVLRDQQFRPPALYLRQDPLAKRLWRDGHNAKGCKVWNGSFAVYFR